jgi:acetylornithine deacetylase/succinyl-diaminopimelate desuccinylase family protein
LEGLLNPELSKVLQYIDSRSDRIVDLCVDLVRTCSINPQYPNIDAAKAKGGESRCNEILAECYHDLGCDVDLFEGAPGRHNLVGVLRGEGGGRSLIFNGHIDTVPFTEPEKWLQKNPLSGAIANGRVYGRGACDMKGGLVAQAMAAKAIVDSNVKLKGDLILESVLGEEWMEHEIGTTAVIKRGYRADGAIIAEPSAPPVSLAVVPATSGMLWMSLTCLGIPAHFSIRDEVIRTGGGAEIGVHAVDKGIMLLNALQALEREWVVTKNHPLFQPGHFTIYPGAISGGPRGTPVPFQLAGYCTIEYAIWYPPDQEPSAIKKEIEDYVLRASQLDPWLRENPPEIKWNMNWPATSIDSDHPLVHTMLNAHESVSQRRASVRDRNVQGFCAVCDASFLNDENIPSIVYGPGSLYQAHSENEFVAIDELVTATKALAAAAMTWCGVSEEEHPIETRGAQREDH